MLILQKKDNSFTLIMTDMNLPDIHGLEFVKIVERETRLPIVVMCDASDQHMVMDGLTSGAIMLGLVKPLSPDDFKPLWQLPFLKKREVLLESRQPLIPGSASAQQGGVESSESHQMGLDMPESSGSRSKKRRADEMEIGRGFPMGHTSPVLWTPDLHSRFVQVVNDLGIFTTPQEIASRINVPGVTANVVAQKLQQFNIPLNQQHIIVPSGGTINIVAPSGSTVNIIATSDTAPNPPCLPNQYMHQRTNNHLGVMYRQGHNPLTMLMQNPHSRDQLKRIVMVSQHNWAFQHGDPGNRIPGACALNNSAVVQGLHQFPPMSVPVALARKIELCVYAVLNAKYAPPGSTVAVPVGDNEIGADDILNAVLELLAGR